MGLDWKQDVETLEWRIESALTGNFGMSADLPDFRTYGNKSISAPSVLPTMTMPCGGKDFSWAL